MNLEVTDIMLQELQSSKHEASSMCESESACETVMMNQEYSYNGTFGPKSNGNSKIKSTAKGLAHMF